MKRALTTAAVIVAVVSIAWCSGIDFDKRGLSVGGTLYAAIAAGLLAYFCPAWGDK